MFRETSLFYVDDSFVDMFSVDVLHGDALNPLSEPGSIVLTEETAMRYFGTADAVGEVLAIGDTLDVRVEATVRSFPTNSHFRFNALVSMDTMKRFFPDIDERWSPHVFFTYALMSDGANVAAIETRLPDYVSQAVQLSGEYAFTFLFQPLTWVAADRWLEGFAYRIDVDPVALVAGGVALALLAAATVSYHAIRAATANPVEALRSE